MTFGNPMSIRDRVQNTIDLGRFTRATGLLQRRRLNYLRAAKAEPLNGQQRRMEIFRALDAHFKFDAFIETGTYLGRTTRFFAESGRPVWTCEINRMHVFAAAVGLDGIDNVTLVMTSSEKFLRLLAPTLGQSRVFIYLDAHWNDYLPLRDEFEIIRANFPNAVVMVDDFKVPNDPGYAYDNYGPGKSLELSYLGNLVAPDAFSTYVPKAPSNTETGFRRGTLFATHNQVFKAHLDQEPLLRQVTAKDA
ncbi:MAG: hypothetical protein RL291_1694 [Pseudomonadota bacterium]